MKQKLLIFGALCVLVIVLIGLNAASYTQKEKEPDNEIYPNRTTYNAGTTGTRAFFELLNETGRKVTRWQEPPEALLGNKNAPRTFVIVGALKRSYSEPEAAQLLRWVAGGGRLVVIDRDPPKSLLTTTTGWNIALKPESDAMIAFSLDPSDQVRMTKNVRAAKPVQPTAYTRKITAVQPSLLASEIVFEKYKGGINPDKKKPGGRVEGTGTSLPPPPPPKAQASPSAGDGNYFRPEQLSATPAPVPPKTFESGEKRNEEKTITVVKSGETPITANGGEDDSDEEEEEADIPVMNAPVVHLAGDGGNLLVDVPYGAGRIVYLSDPFIVSNSGINLVDNAQIGINLVTGGDGGIAFDEYHHGYGTNNNRLFQYFEGTPVISIFLQIALLAGLILFSQSRRFARAVPEYEPNRLSKLEHVAAMAELQQRAGAFDLAMENIYTDFKRRAARSVGADVFGVSRGELARLMGERARVNAAEIEKLMSKCEDVMHGEATNRKEVLRLAGGLRELEEKLGLKRNRRTKI